MGMTLTEKILAKASGRTKVEPGENIWVETDVLMTHDVCGPGTIGVFKREFGENAKVWNPEKIVLIPDHYIFTNDERANRNVDILRDFAALQGIKYFYDITDRSDFKANPDLPQGFLMSVKAPCGLTHSKRLYSPQKWLARIREGLKCWGDRLGILLVQLSPQFACDSAQHTF
jgi:hypothetical protein